MGVPICSFCGRKTRVFWQKLATEWMAGPFHSFCGTKMSLRSGTERKRNIAGWIAVDEGRRSRRSFLPSRLRGALWKALLACLRKTSWKPHRSGQQREEFISRPPAGDLDGLLLPSEDKLSEGAGTPCQPKKRNGYLQPAKRALPDGSLCPARITARYLLAVLADDPLAAGDQGDEFGGEGAAEVGQDGDEGDGGPDRDGGIGGVAADDQH